MDHNSEIEPPHIRGQLATHKPELQLKAVKDMISTLPSLRPQIGLLDLPLELHLQIYHHLIPRKRIVEVSLNRFDFGLADPLYHCHSALADSRYHKENNAILRISKQISNEGLDILYGQNIFIARIHEEGEAHLKKYFTEPNMRKIRSLIVVAEPGGISYEAGSAPEAALWSSILPNLKELRIVASQPIQEPFGNGAPRPVELEERMERWVGWFTPYLRCFGRYLSNDATVLVDVNGRSEMKDIMGVCLMHDYREARCRLAGDLIFERGRWSWEGESCAMSGARVAIL